MKKYPILVAIVCLLSASLACSFITKALSGGAPTTEPTQTNTQEAAIPTAQETVDASATDALSTDTPAPADTSVPATDSTQQHNTEFPLPPNLVNFTDLGDGSISIQVKMSLADATAFYRDAFAAKGFKERTVNTAISDTTFSLVFDGDASGKAIIVQGVDLGQGVINISIRKEKI